MFLLINLEAYEQQQKYSEVDCNKCCQMSYLEIKNVSSVAFEFWDLDILQTMNISAANSSSAHQHVHLANTFSSARD